MFPEVQDAWDKLAAEPKRIDLSTGIEMHYWEAGQGTPLLFVPGWTFTADVFVHQIIALSKSNRVIAIDPRSQGRSSVTSGGNEYATHAKDLDAFIQALDLQDVILIGWSAGAAETWGYIRLSGLDRIKAHICIDLPPKCLSHDEEIDWVEGTLADISSGVMTMSNRKTLRDFVTWYTTNVMIQRALSDRELQWIIAQSETTPDWAALSLFSYLMFTDYRPEVSLLDRQRPSLFVVAEHWADKAKPYIAKNWPNSQIAILGGHMMFWEYPDQFNQLLRRFVDGIK